MPFTFKPLEIPDVVEVTPKAFADERGTFAELFKESEFARGGVAFTVKQVNQSVSKRGVIRGLHYQKGRAAQAKLVQVVRGEVFDVAVDIRRDLSTFGQWVSLRLLAEKGNMLYVPVGFAHGFCVVSPVAEVVYYCSAEYAPELEEGIIWNDATLAIPWPVDTPILSDKDSHYGGLAEAYV